MANILSVEDRHRTIVQNQPTLLVTNGYDRVAYLVFIVLHDDETQIIGRMPSSRSATYFRIA